MENPETLDVDAAIAERELARERAAETDRVHDLYRVIERGMDAQKFLSTPLGQFLIDRAEKQRQGFLEELAKIDVETVDGRTQYRDLRLQIGILENPFALLTEVVGEGKDAEGELLESESPAL